jgi:hypothetical protein
MFLSRFNKDEMTVVLKVCFSRFVLSWEYLLNTVQSGWKKYGGFGAGSVSGTVTEPRLSTLFFYLQMRCSQPLKRSRPIYFHPENEQCPKNIVHTIWLVFIHLFILMSQRSCFRLEDIWRSWTLHSPCYENKYYSSETPIYCFPSEHLCC